MPAAADLVFGPAMAGTLETSPGFRRRFVVTPEAGRVTAALEDDIHCMAVTLHHDGVRVTHVEAVMDRWPWTTCPGAIEVVQATFVGAELASPNLLRVKTANCTHLYDLAALAAAHAAEVRPLRYDIVVGDPVDGLVVAEIRRDGALVHRLEHRDDIVLSPPAAAGVSLFKLRGWIETLEDLEREAARLLQWGTILAHGRTIPLAAQSDATRIPPNCFTFQPARREQARRFGRVIDFSAHPDEPLSHFDGRRFAAAGHAPVS